MPRGPARPWRKLLPHTERAIPYIRAAIDAGYDIELAITEVADDEWRDLKKGLFNAAKLNKVAVHVHQSHNEDGTWTLTYAVHDKTKARAYVLNTYGSDREKWAYNPRRPSPRDENGRRTDIDG
jgi:hypothetical protein